MQFYGLHFFLPSGPDVNPETSPKYILQQMFREMVEQKNSSLISRYYHPDFLLFTNGKTQNYKSFAEGHTKIYATSISYIVSYDEDTWVESGSKVAVRCWIKTQQANDDAVEFEVVLIATFVDSKIHRLWELTWPDWSMAKAFEQYPASGNNRAGNAEGEKRAE